MRSQISLYDHRNAKSKYMYTNPANGHSYFLLKQKLGRPSLCAKESYKVGTDRHVCDLDHPNDLWLPDYKNKNYLQT